MALFRRRSASVEVPAGTLDDAEEQSIESAEDTDLGAPAADLGADEATVPVVVYDRSAGPFDESELDQAEADLLRLDLGSLRIPALPGSSVQVEVDQNTQQVRAVTVIAGEAAVQLQAFAAPRSEGLWEEVRTETSAELTATAGAEVTAGEGPLGAELRAIVPARTPQGAQVRQPVRFTGIDGPRWLLRAVFLGRAAVDPEPDELLLRLVRQTVVVRGDAAMAPRDPLPLRLPEEPPTEVTGPGDKNDLELDTADVEDIDDADDDAPGRRYADLDPFERGPEITEIR